MISKSKLLHFIPACLQVTRSIFTIFSSLHGDSKTNQSMLLCNSKEKDASNKGSKEQTSLGDLLKNKIC